MKNTKLDAGLLDKIVKASGKSKQYIREQISRRAGRRGVSSLGAQLLWARDLSIGTAHALNRASQSAQEEFRNAVRLGLPTQKPSVTANAPNRRTAVAAKSRRQGLNAAIVNLVILDSELRARCRDLILARGHYDRALREATTVLEDRIKKLSDITNLTSVPLLGKALNPEPLKAVVVVSNEKEDQSGFFYICMGIMQAFRNKTHHNLSDAFTQVDALKFCGFIDTVLAVLAKGQVYLDRR
jgi:uncharacterized protein (TIGR02391 family)